MKYLEIILLLFVTVSGQGQGRHNVSHNGDKIILAFLKEGEYKADVMDSVTMSPRTQELMQKFRNAMQENPDWFLKGQKKVRETGKPLPYDVRTGMTEEEYVEFWDLMQTNSGIEMAKSATESVSIKHSNGKITFKGTGALNILNDVSIDVTGQLATIGQLELKQRDSVNVLNDKNALKSKWTGLIWTFETANKNIENVKTIADYQDLTMKIYKVKLGYLEATKKLFMEIQKSEIENGRKTLAVQLPFIFH